MVGGVVGNNCNIGSNVTVFKNVPDNTTVVCQAPSYLEHRENREGRGFKFHVLSSKPVLGKQ